MKTLALVGETPEGSNAVDYCSSSRKRVTTMFDQGGHGNALAAGNVLVALIDTLVEKDILSRTDARSLLTRADDMLKPTSAIFSTMDARKIISALLERYPE
jgi:hypothetical protein